MALLHIKKKLFRNILLAIVILFSISSFVVFLVHTSVDSSSSPNLPREINNKKRDDSQFVRQMAQDIQLTQDKIMNNTRSYAALRQKMVEPERELPRIPEKNVHLTQKSEFKTKPNYNVHIFYYPWYKSEKFDGKYAHWNHELLPHWNDKTNIQRMKHKPPDDIGANFYPQLGAYSSSDPVIIDTHMRQIRASGAGVVSVSWYPPGYEGQAEVPVDNITMKLLDAADKYELKITFHLEPFKNRNGETLREVVKYVIDTYGHHSAFYRFESSNGRKRPVFYVYDSYQIDPTLWAEALSKGGKFSVRDTEYDAVFLGLLVEPQHFSHLTESSFDGFYTYFVSNNFVFGSTWANWPKISEEAKQRNLMFVPSIGPGYVDTRVRAWNGQNTKLRLNGRYYKSAFYSALSVKPELLSITSFNEWHEGTQVEPAVPKTVSNFQYEDYRPNSPEFYLNLTQIFVEEYHRVMTQAID